MDININQSVSFDFQNYRYGDTFLVVLFFWADTKKTIPQDVSAAQFFMDIRRDKNCGCWFDVNEPDVETLAVGSGITRGPASNQIIISKILSSLPLEEPYNQSIKIVDANGTRTFEVGTLKIDYKI